MFFFLKSAAPSQGGKEGSGERLYFAKICPPSEMRLIHDRNERVDYSGEVREDNRDGCLAFVHAANDRCKAFS
mgnify:CR=1 FL=1